MGLAVWFLNEGCFPLTKICKVLVVEDQQEIQDLMRELFADEGYRFIIVGDGSAMRRTLDNDTNADIDIVIIDMLLPGGVDGLTLAKEAEARGLPAIVVTGDHRHTELLDASGCRYLLKPFGLDALISLVDMALRETKAQCKRQKRSSSDALDGPVAA